MKITIERCERFVIDTKPERDRINKAFRDRPDIKKRLDKLMDLIEACKWEAAGKELCDVWWNEHDSKDECIRFEYIGMVDRNCGFDHWIGYGDLVDLMINCSSIYKVIEVAKK